MQQVFNVIAIVALVIIGLYVAAVALDSLFDLTNELYWWLRYRVLPGALRIAGIGLVAWVIWRIARSL